MAIMEVNLKADKSGVYKKVCEQLGFSRMGQAIEERLEKALKTVKSQLIVEGDTLTLKQ